MTELHPITPPPELIEEWIELSRPTPVRHPNPNVLATYAARWGADTKLEACVEWMGDSPVIWRGNPETHPGFYLREARRPKPLSLKEQALQVLANADGADHPVVTTVLTADQHALIRKALEQLND
jgi:hypothetical protein